MSLFVFVKNSAEDFVAYEIMADEKIEQLIKSVPTSFYIENDTVKYIIASELPSLYIFLKFIKGKIK